MSDDFLNTCIKLLEQELDRLVPEGNSAYKSLYEGARYSLLSGGKRIRPILTLATAQLLGTQIEKALAPACALEMIHTYSLIHDDLPCMDDDDFRRGKPSLHKVYTEGHAVLVGDFLLTYAFEVIVKAPHLSATQKMQLVEVLSRAAGGEGMIGGQVLDIAQASVSLEELHERKTGALFTAAVQCGGIVANCSPSIYEGLTRFGQQIGFLFQVVDDVLDNEHGFSKADALKAAEKTYAVLTHLPGDSRLLAFIIQKIVSQIDQLMPA